MKHAIAAILLSALLSGAAKAQDDMEWFPYDYPLLVCASLEALEQANISTYDRSQMVQGGYCKVLLDDIQWYVLEIKMFKGWRIRGFQRKDSPSEFVGWVNGSYINEHSTKKDPEIARASEYKKKREQERKEEERKMEMERECAIDPLYDYNGPEKYEGDVPVAYYIGIAIGAILAFAPGAILIWGVRMRGWWPGLQTIGWTWVALMVLGIIFGESPPPCEAYGFYHR